MNKIYYIERNDSVGWDEYDSAVVIAESVDEAISILKEKHGNDWWYDGSWKNYDVSVTEVDITEKRIVIESFNAG